MLTERLQNCKALQEIYLTLASQTTITSFVISINMKKKESFHNDGTHEL